MNTNVTEFPITRSKAIELMGVSPSTFDRMVRANNIKKVYVRNSSVPYYLKSDLRKIFTDIKD